MSKIRSVRQRTDAPRQDEGPGTGAALPAAGGGIPRIRGCRRPPVRPARADRRAARFTALAALAVQRDSPGLLGAGWLANVTWDALHHRGRGPTRVRSWYPPLCIGYDVALAAPLLTGQL